MKSPIIQAAALAVAGLLSGACARDHIKQDNTVTWLEIDNAAGMSWQTGNLATIQTLDGMPIYSSAPSKPYTVLGQIIAVGQTPREAAVRLGREHGADALVFKSQVLGMDPVLQIQLTGQANLRIDFYAIHFLP